MRALAPILLASALCGCTSMELLYWSQSSKTPGRLEGVLREARHDLVLYSFALDQGERGFRAFDVPHDWNESPRTFWKTEHGLTLVALSAPLPCSPCAPPPVRRHECPSWTIA